MGPGARWVAWSLPFLLAWAPGDARAVPSFARQTGLSCTSCHTVFPQLTSYGRWFKLNGYTEQRKPEGLALPPLAVMAMPSFTHTDRGIPGGAAEHFGDNDNFALTQASLFYAGRLFGPYAEKIAGEQIGSYLDHIGTFFQGTYDGVARHWSWDNAEIRIATRRSLFDRELIYGVYANNNPSMQDVWNTTPAWSFPFSSSGLAPTPAAAPFMTGLGQQVAGAGAYAMLGDRYYAEFGGYTSLSASAQDAMGTDPEGETQIPGFAPYWRLAVEPDWGKSNHLEIGTYGMYAGTYPGRMRGEGKDHLTDIGVDAQYQYASDLHDVTARLNVLHENQDWRASRPLGLASHSSDELWSAAASASYLYDKTYGVDLQYFILQGDRDPSFYADSRTGSPRSDGVLAQLDWLPLNRRGGPSFWPKSNLKLSAQYVHYFHFDGSSLDHDGTGRRASDEDTLYLELWLVM